MSVSLELEHIQRPGYAIDLFVPNAQEVLDNYFLQKQEQQQVPFPHWTKIWPCGFGHGRLYTSTSWNKSDNKKVLELAAGLGLPGFVAARLCSISLFQ